MNKYAEYKEAYKAIIKESAGIKDFINKGILPAFSKSKAIEAGTSKIDDLMANAKAKIYPKKNIEGSIEQLLYNKSDANYNAALIKAVEEAKAKAMRNVGIGVGGAAALGGAGYGTYKALEPEETTTDKIMNTLRNVFAQANSEYTESLIKKAYAEELLKNAGVANKLFNAQDKTALIGALLGSGTGAAATATSNAINGNDITDNLLRNTLIGAGFGGGAGGLAGSKVGKRLFDGSSMVDDAMGTQAADLPFLGNIAKNSYANRKLVASLLKNAGAFDTGKKMLSKYWGNLSGSSAREAASQSDDFFKKFIKQPMGPVNPKNPAMSDAAFKSFNRRYNAMNRLARMKDRDRDKTQLYTGLGLGGLATVGSAVSALTPEKTPQEKVMDQLRSLVG